MSFSTITSNQNPMILAQLEGVGLMKASRVAPIDANH